MLRGIEEGIVYLKEHLGPGTTSFNFIMSEGEKVYAYRSTYCNPEHYSLLYRRREETEKYPGRSIIISSERVSRGEWEPIGNGQLLVVDKLLHTSKRDF